MNAYLLTAQSLLQAWQGKLTLSALAVLIGEALARILHIPIDFLALMVLLIIGDTITGMIAAKRRGEKLTSGGMRRTISKATSYFIFVFLSAGVGNTVGASGIPLISDTMIHLGPLAAAYVCLTELRSVWENTEMGDWLDRLRELAGQMRP